MPLYSSSHNEVSNNYPQRHQIQIVQGACGQARLKGKTHGLGRRPAQLRLRGPE